jgi:hypothetical protein
MTAQIDCNNPMVGSEEFHLRREEAVIASPPMDEENWGRPVMAVFVSKGNAVSIMKVHDHQLIDLEAVR